MQSLAGKLLVANGSLFGAVFRQSVILIADHDENGALGFVVNQPTLMVIDRDGSASGVMLVDETVFSGGPVQQGILSVLALFESPEAASRVIFDSVGLLAIDSADPRSVVRARVFAGYSGWGPGQLENEMEEDSWVVTTPTADLIFETAPEDMWSEALRRMGGDYALMATMPYDPSVN